MKTIFDATTLRGRTLKNRIFRSATWMGMAENGCVTDEIVSMYQKLAQGQVAGIVTGFTSVVPWDGELPGALRFFEPEHVKGHTRLTKAVHESGSLIFLQAAMLDTYVASGQAVPVNALTLNDFADIVEAYKKAAIHAVEAGYDGLQIHGAHFFGLSKCLSPLCNQRNDAYGGSVERRAKIVLDILQAVRLVVSNDFIILIKINCSDFMSGGLSENDFISTSLLLADAGIDAIEVSGNYTSRPHIRAGVNEAYFKEAAVALRHRTTCPIILVGGVRSLDVANALVDQDDMTYVSLSRPLLCEPNLIARWQAGDSRPARCISCNSCYHTEHHRCILHKGGTEEDA